MNEKKQQFPNQKINIRLRETKGEAKNSERQRIDERKSVMEIKAGYTATQDE